MGKDLVSGQRNCRLDEFWASPTPKFVIGEALPNTQVASGETTDNQCCAAVCFGRTAYRSRYFRGIRGITVHCGRQYFVAEAESGVILLVPTRAFQICNQNRKTNFAKVPKCSCSKVQEHGLGYTEIHAKLSPKAHCKSGLVLHIRHY